MGSEAILIGLLTGRSKKGSSFGSPTYVIAFEWQGNLPLLYDRALAFPTM